ncbi:MAG: NAD(P)/FAD-dependent oxidoreductase [Burkholderiales bacterium]|nr:NAD(P)/FAD-dependent oxidoreductase [Burkholderiales bacterium]
MAQGTGHWDAIVIGAGAAGMMCAAKIGQRGRRVLLIEHARKLAEKIRISGGGRCNFTNLHCAPENYLSQNPHFCRSALARYTPQHFIALIERYRIKYEERSLGQLFCIDSAQQIIDMLKCECERGSVHWRMPCEVRAVRREGGAFVVDTDQGTYGSHSLVVASGGLSVPKIGAGPFGYRIAEQFGMKIVAPRPGLVPLSFGPETLERFGDLSGISIDAEVSCNGGSFRENLLLTHRGLSGPVILQVSSYWRPGDAIEIDLLPDRDALAWLMSEHSNRLQLSSLLAQQLPKRFAQQWCEAHDALKPLNQLSQGTLHTLAQELHCWKVKPSGTLGYNKAEVTLGGVDTDGLSSKTMEAKSVPGLYFIGEVVDVTGHLGGFNFQWAWASAQAAGQAA